MPVSGAKSPMQPALVQAHTLKDPTGRASYLPPDNVELWRCELVRNACMVALACPYSTAATKPPPMLTTRELIRLLTTAIRCGYQAVPQAPPLPPCFILSPPIPLGNMQSCILAAS